MKNATRTIAGRKYTNIAGKWTYEFSAHHTIVIEKVQTGYKATEIITPHKGSYMDGTKYATTRATYGTTLQEAAENLNWIIANDVDLNDLHDQVEDFGRRYKV